MSDWARTLNVSGSVGAASDPLQDLLDRPQPDVTNGGTGGVLVGRLVGMLQGVIPLVTYSGQPTTAAQTARTTVELRESDIGHEVVLMFECADPHRPLIMGRIVDANALRLKEQLSHADVDVDGERLVLSAKGQLVLRCGKASITLTPEGKVLISGAYVSSRSTGVLRLKGASVQIN